MAPLERDRTFSQHVFKYFLVCKHHQNVSPARSLRANLQRRRRCWKSASSRATVWSRTSKHRLDVPSSVHLVVHCFHAKPALPASVLCLHQLIASFSSRRSVQLVPSLLSFYSEAAALLVCPGWNLLGLSPKSLKRGETWVTKTYRQARQQLTFSCWTTREVGFENLVLTNIRICSLPS